MERKVRKIRWQAIVNMKDGSQDELGPDRDTEEEAKQDVADFWVSVKAGATDANAIDFTWINNFTDMVWER